MGTQEPRSPGADRPATFPAQRQPAGASAALRSGWQTGWHYFRRGLRVLAFTPWLYAGILSLFALPAVAAALLTLYEAPPGLGGTLLRFILTGIASTVAPVMVMIPVAAGFHGQNLGLIGSLRDGSVWFPRYLWTNLHTTVIFWVPIGSLVALHLWRGGAFPLSGVAGVIVDALSILLIAAAGLYMHSRTLLAPFLAVHGKLPGTLAALESWRLSGRYFPQVFGMFIVSSAPAAVPLAVLIVGLYLALEGVPGGQAAMGVMLPSLVWVAIKVVRPFLVTATYALYEDFWGDELRQRELHGAPPTPRPLRPLLWISWWLPRLAGYALGRRIDKTL